MFCFYFFSTKYFFWPPPKLKPKPKQQQKEPPKKTPPTLSYFKADAENYFCHVIHSFVVDMTPLNLDRVQNWINQGRIDPSRPITIKELGDSRCINPSKVGDGIKLLARGATEKISHPLNIVVSRASKAAISAVESAGGSVLTRYYTPFSIRRIMQGKTDPINSLQSQAPSATTTTTAAATVMRMPKFTSSTSTSSAAAAAAAASADMVVEPRGESESESESVQEGRGEEEGIIGRMEEEKGVVKKLVVWQNRLPDPVSRKAIEYYRDPAHRGYLSYQVGQGQGPSLFFKAPRPPPAGDGVGGVGGEELAFASASNDSTSTTSATTSTKSKKKGQAAANRIW